MDLYTQSTLSCSRCITHHYSTSFSLGIKALHSDMRLPVYAIYGFVRYADEIVDTFHQFDKQKLLHRFKMDIKQALQSQISMNPVLHAFQYVVNKYHIKEQLIDDFLFSMEMDLTKTCYNRRDYEEYIFGSAEAVGLMCLQVFCNGNEGQYNQLEPSAKRLGAAFQKVNFLRDMADDKKQRGRVYFPGVDFATFGTADKRIIEDNIQADFDAALYGIRRLPKGARAGVYLAYVYYYSLFKKIKHLTPDRILHSRVRIHDIQKALLLSKSLLLNRLNYLK